MTANFRETPIYQQAFSFLFDRINFERVKKMPYSKRDLNILRMGHLLSLLGDPHKELRIVHVAGTKGKGSTSAFLTSAFVAGGVRCGSYTSPHLHYVEERFRTDGKPCSPEHLVELVESVRPAVEEMDRGKVSDQPTYFEICTAIAFLLFVREQVDVAILEVGLGGRLDSTNVCDPLVSVITSISFDHTKQLGNTLREIATEKAGIIKPGIPVVSGADHDEARQAIAKIANENRSQVYELGHDFVYEYSSPTPSELGIATFQARGTLTNAIGEASSSTGSANLATKLGLVGEHQARNAAIAWATLQLLPTVIRPNDEAIQKGFETTRCEARIEVVAHEPEVILDSSHNVASVQALVDVLGTVYADRHRTLILGASIGKDIRGMLEILLPAFDRVILTEYVDNPRAVKAAKLLELCDDMKSSLAKVSCEPDRHEALKRAREMSRPDDLICITGSFFIAAEMADLLSQG